MNNFKEIHIGSLISKGVQEKKIDIARICRFFQTEEQEILSMYSLKSLDTDMLLKWSKLLRYDFFRVYTQHLVLYSPPDKRNIKILMDSKNAGVPQFRKNIYTKEVIDFLLEMIKTGEKSKQEVIEEYKIPKTTLYKWLVKYRK